MKLNRRTSATRLQGKRIAIGVTCAAVVVLIAGAVWYFFIRSANNTSTATQETVHTSTVRSGDIRVSASGSGALAAAEQVDLSFSTAGTVAELNVKVGDHVAKGDVLARLGRIEKLEADVASRQVALLEAQQALTTLQGGGSVALAQAYQDWVTAQVAYNEANLASQRTVYSRCSEAVNLRYAATLERAKDQLDTLTQKSYGSQEWIDAKSAYDTASANVAYCKVYSPDEKTEAKANLDLTAVKMKQAEEAYNKLKDSAGINSDELALAEAKVNQAGIALDLARESLDGATLVAPIDGTVLSIAAGKGEMIDTGVFITLADLTRPNVTVQVDETDLDKLVTGIKAEITFDAIPDKVFTGTVTQVDPALVSSGQYQVVKGLISMDEVPTANGRPAPLGLNAGVEVIFSEAKNVLQVPVEALRDLGDGEYGVFVQGQGGKLRFRQVEVGLMNTAFAEIRSGLSAGEIVSTGLVESGS